MCGCRSVRFERARDVEYVQYKQARDGGEGCGENQLREVGVAIL